MQSLDLPILIFAVAAAIALVASGASWFAEVRPAQRHANRRMSLLATAESPAAVTTRLLARARRISMPGALAGLVSSLDERCRQAAPELSMPRVLMWVGGGFAALGLPSGLMALRLGPGAIWLALIGSACLVLAVAWVVLGSMAAKRQKRLGEQLPDALDLMIRALRAGHPVSAALRLASEEMADPLGTELGLVVDETLYGVDLNSALANLAQRTRLEDFAFLAVSVSIQTQTGGNLAEILGNLARVVRGRFILDKKVKALASEGRMSAVILSVLPALMVGAIMMMQPDYYLDVLDHPWFAPSVLGVMALYCVGLFLIHRITHFKY